LNNLLQVEINLALEHCAEVVARAVVIKLCHFIIALIILNGNQLDVNESVEVGLWWLISTLFNTSG